MASIKRLAITWLTAILVPVAFIFLGLILVSNQFFLALEYRMPGFPADQYGFTLTERLKWSKFALDYLNRNEEITYLQELEFEDGQKLFNDRELSHMVDVNKVFQPSRWAGIGSWIGLLGLWILAKFSHLKRSFQVGLRRGGWIVVILLAGIGLFALTSFWQFFEVFHGVFFEGDSWLFYYSDTLIRLFPLRFWQDIFIVIGSICLAGGLGLVLGVKPSKHTGV